MGLARAWSIGLHGVDGDLVEIEADLGPGLPGLSLVGLPDAALAEARDRVRAAVVNSGESWPARKITLALSPATLPKQGSSYDVALACGVLAAHQQLRPSALEGLVLLGELAHVHPAEVVRPAAQFRGEPARELGLADAGRADQ